MKQKVDKLISIGAVSPADRRECPYASKTVCTPKKDEMLRMCVDYRDMNKQTEKDAFFLPCIDHLWPILSGAKYFASLDLLICYHQVEVDFHDRAKAAFLTHRILYIFNMMPFCFCNAPSTFQRLMKRLLNPLINVEVLVYLDDVLIYDDTPEQLIDTFAAVVKQLAQAGLI